MKIDIKIIWKHDIIEHRGSPVFEKLAHSKGDIQTITVDSDYIEEKLDLLLAIEDEIGEYDEDVDYSIIDEEQFWNALAGDPIENLEKIRNVLRRYFETDDNDNPNKEYDENYSAQAAISDIHSIVGNI